MENSLVLEEKYSRYWKHALALSLIVSLITFLIYLYIDDAVLAGISRLVAFISLSLAIFCLLKVMEGAKTFEVTISDGLLRVTYFKNEKAIGTDKLNINDIETIYSEPYQIELPISDYRIQLSNNRTFRVNFKENNENDISLFKFGGRVLTLDKSSKERLEHFLSHHDLLS
ncbi:hypothetical protein G3570_07035 [Balneolaceae bacterium YR4-1]|uniref:Uncharacterized protein n=1 Tax=Halalkalibaculum roseum TaxID=2709311 RepID=A0A6M1SMW0_9BACT|nr:hypothetical protein [Halalkalibaculum roseum]NGP76379.1 hypothetical protein [Halalkalibaculum roseum]